MSYTSLNDYCRKTFHKKLYKLTLDGGFTCPNRDGTIGTSGCIFCDGSGSGAFAGVKNGEISASCFSKQYLRNVPPITDQLAFQKSLISGKLPKTGEVGYIAYFQAFTGTYAPLSYLEKVYLEALSDPQVDVLSIATRPDCISKEVITLIQRLREKTGKPIWVELGLQTIHPQTAAYIRRGYPLHVYDQAVQMLHAIGIPQIITHVILGLPGETKEMMLDTVSYVAGSDSNGIKLQLLHVLKDTDLADCYRRGEFQTLEMVEYLDILKDSLALLPPDMVVHRLTGDGARNNLLAPLWSLDKKRVLNAISGLK